MSPMMRLWGTVAFLVVVLHASFFLMSFPKAHKAQSGSQPQFFEIVDVRVLESKRPGIVSSPFASPVAKETPKVKRHAEVRGPLLSKAPKKVATPVSVDATESNREASQASRAPDLAAGKREKVVYAARPIYAPRPPYPASERRKGREGRVMLSLLVDTFGHVQEAQVRETSGSEAFDDSALKAVKRWRFAPARDRDGQALSRWCTVRILFQIDR